MGLKIIETNKSQAHDLMVQAARRPMLGYFSIYMVLKKLMFVVWSQVMRAMFL